MNKNYRCGHCRACVDFFELVDGVKSGMRSASLLAYAKPCEDLLLPWDRVTFDGHRGYIDDHGDCVIMTPDDKTAHSRLLTGDSPPTLSLRRTEGDATFRVVDDGAEESHTLSVADNGNVFLGPGTLPRVVTTGRPFQVQTLSYLVEDSQKFQWVLKAAQFCRFPVIENFDEYQAGAETLAIKAACQGIIESSAPKDILDFGDIAIERLAKLKELEE